MAQIRVSEALVKRIRWLGGFDPTWTDEDGCPTTKWAVTQALALLEGITRAGQPYQSEPQITATARGGIEFMWKGNGGREVDVVLPPDAGHPIEIEIAWVQERDRTLGEEEHEVPTVQDALALIARIVPWTRRRSELNELGDEALAALYAEFSDEDRELANVGSVEYAGTLASLDREE